jgi:hypothetical protein
MHITNSSNLGFALLNQLSALRIRRSVIYGAIIIAALIAFETFNYSTTDYALTDLLGELKFAGLRWATILSLAFCGIDFAGVARLFSPEKDTHQSNEVWYLFAAWLLAATMNATLTWWGVSMAIVSHPSQSTAVVSQNTLYRVVPVFVAIMVWLIRILIIGSLSMSGDRLLAQTQPAQTMRSRPVHTSVPSATVTRPVAARPSGNSHITGRITARPAAPTGSAYPRQEPSYHNLSARAHQASFEVQSEAANRNERS